jgi:DNA (cytosine-5)-methyltransferase 1
MKVLDLFSGIGGFSLGLESTGYFQTIAFVEKDKFCRQVLQKNFNNIPIEEDIRNVRGERYKADVITSGFPCQPFSVAGKRKGTDDDRYLWDETIRVVSECKPKYFIGENVEGIININNGMVLRQVQDDLEKEGFQVRCLVIPASGIGAWHQRKRVWIIAANSNSRFSIGENEEIQARRNTINSSSKDVPNTNTNLRKWRGAEFKSGDDREWGFCSKEEEQAGYDIRSKTIGCDDISGEEKRTTWWQTQSRICGVPHGLSATMDKNRANRIKALGNSIVPQIARQLGLAIMKAETE